MKHYKNYSVEDGGVKININTDRLQSQVQQAQFLLDTIIMNDMIPYMPAQTFDFIRRTKAISDSWAGTGQVCAGAGPTGRVLYNAIIMIDPLTGRGPIPILDNGELMFRYRKGAKLVPGTKHMEFSKAAHPNAQERWFEAAKRDNLKKWENEAKKPFGGSNNG